VISKNRSRRFFGAGAAVVSGAEALMKAPEKRGRGLDRRETRRRIVGDMSLSGEYLPSTSEWARQQAETFEASGGQESAELRGVPIIVLTTVGAKTGGLRKTALMRVEHDGKYAVVASKGGAPEHPAWFYNLVKNPRVALQDGDVKKEYDAHQAEGAEREEWWGYATEVWPDYDEYQKKTERRIELFVLEPVD
jgi:deazaflavin-dependent oxidoreductase (nitroreductase family)